VVSRWLLLGFEAWELGEETLPAFRATLTCVYHLVGHPVFRPLEHPGVNPFFGRHDTCRLAVSRGLCSRGPYNGSCLCRRRTGSFDVSEGPSHRIAASGCCASSATGTLESDMMVLPVYLACLAMLTYPFLPFRVDCQVERSSASDVTSGRQLFAFVRRQSFTECVTYCCDPAQPLAFTIMSPSNILDPSAVVSLIPTLLPPDSKKLGSSHDALAALLHAMFTALAFRLTAVNETAVSSSGNVLPKDWNNSGPRAYNFTYKHEQSSLEFSVSLAKLGTRTLINAIPLEVRSTNPVLTEHHG
jgi:PI31 proteasome regulator N-terminal